MFCFPAGHIRKGLHETRVDLFHDALKRVLSGNVPAHCWSRQGHAGGLPSCQVPCTTICSHICQQPCPFRRKGGLWFHTPPDTQMLASEKALNPKDTSHPTPPPHIPGQPSLLVSLVSTVSSVAAELPCGPCSTRLLRPRWAFCLWCGGRGRASVLDTVIVLVRVHPRALSLPLR